MKRFFTAQNGFRIIPVLFFAAYFIIGCFIFSDYGTGIDEEAQRTNGKNNVEYLFTGNKNIGFSYHGAIWQIILYGAENIFGQEHLADVYALRHFLNFLLFFASSIFLYFTFRRLLLNQWLSLLGSAFYVLMPRIFADSFINPKDTVFLSAVTIAGYYLLVWLFSRTNKALLGFAVATGFACAIRVLGVLIPVLGVTVFLLTSINRKKDMLKSINYLVLSGVFMVVFWPAMWRDPFIYFTGAFQHMSNYPATIPNLYFGEFVAANNLPWHYLPVWFIITTPLVYLLLFAAGFSLTAKRFYTAAVKDRKIPVIVAYSGYLSALFFVPFIAVIIKNSAVYDAWRHIFFVFSPFIVLVTLHLSVFIENTASTFYRSIAAFFVVFCAYLVFWNVKNHPHQNTYFNILANRLYDIKTTFDMDYWEVGYKQAMERLVEIENSDTIRYHLPNYPLLYPLKTQKTFVFCADENTGQPEYFISNYRYHPQDYPYAKIDSIMADGNEIIGIYRLR